MTALGQRRYYTGGRLERALDIAEMRAMAHRRLPAFVREYVEGGSETEGTLSRNLSAFADYRWVHRALVDCSKRDTSRTILGVSSALPFAIGPTGFNGMLWKHGDTALAKAAKASGIPFASSMVASDRLEYIAKESGTTPWFQVTLLSDTRLADALIERADNLGSEVLFVTLDTPVLGARLWNDRRYSKPMHLSLRSKLDVLAHPSWFFSVYVPNGLPGFGNLEEFLPPEQRSPLDGARLLGKATNAGVVWADIEKVRARWKRKLVLKGLMSLQDVQQAIKIGADGVVLSNHGGRQLDDEVAPLDVLPEIASAVGDKIEILVDGGFRRGSDIAKAIALGARGVLLGRATLYGLAAGGETGAFRVIELLRTELERVLALVGCPSVGMLSPAFLKRSGGSVLRRPEGVPPVVSDVSA